MPCRRKLRPAFRPPVNDTRTSHLDECVGVCINENPQPYWVLHQPTHLPHALQTQDQTSRYGLNANCGPRWSPKESGYRGRACHDVYTAIFISLAREMQRLKAKNTVYAKGWKQKAAGSRSRFRDPPSFTHKCDSIDQRLGCFGIHSRDKLQDGQPRKTSQYDSLTLD